MSHFNLYVGSVLMAGCGTALARHLGAETRYQVFFAGFALGIILLGQFPATKLRRRIANIEARLAGLEARDA